MFENWQEWMEREYCGSDSSGPHEKRQQLRLGRWHVSGSLNLPLSSAIPVSLVHYFNLRFYNPQSIYLSLTLFFQQGKAWNEKASLYHLLPCIHMMPVPFNTNTFHWFYLCIYFNHLVDFHDDGKCVRGNVLFILISPVVGTLKITIILIE